MQARITITNPTVKLLQEELAHARSCGNQQFCDRLLALLLFAQQQPLATITQLFAVAASTFYNWLHILLAQGVAALRPSSAPGRKPRLNPQQKQHLRQLVLAGPEQSGFACGCWNAALLQTLIQREFGVLYNQHYVCALLAGLGLSYQKACFVAAARDDAARSAWLLGTWPHIVQQALQRDAMLLFGDEASFAWWGSLGYTWAAKGQQPQVRTGGRRCGYKVFGMLEWFSGELFWAGQKGRFNAQSYCDFIGELLHKTTRHLIIIQDGARYHTAQQTREYMTAHAARITVYQLPAYSPDYNPIEHVWGYVKQGTHNSYFAQFTDLTTRVEQRLKQLQADRMRVQQLMGTPLDDLIGCLPSAA